MPMNTWEAQAYTVQHDGFVDSEQALFHPTIYATQELDVLRILTSIYSRPSQKIEIPCVDTDCPIIICDLAQRDQPIIYANDAFCCMTGYHLNEVIGRNCRFLQTPSGKASKSSRSADKSTIRKMRKAIERRDEIQIEVVNYKKTGEPFRNYLTMIPVEVDGMQLCVGLQCELE